MEIRWIRHDKVTSTNLLLAELQMQRKAKEGMVIIADYQEGGKGQGSNSWHSRKGENLLMSMLLFPAFLSASHQFHLSRLVSVAICEVLESLGVRPVVKWPNDILANWAKIAGILIEHGISGGSISHTIAGIGLNVNQKEFPEFPHAATSLLLETARHHLPRDVGDQLAKRIVVRYHELKEGRENELEQDYLGRLLGMEEASLFEAGGTSFEGIIKGVSPYGELLVEHGGKLLCYRHGEIILKKA